jgi:hypothetical protein
MDIFDKSRLGNNNGSESRRFVTRERITRAVTAAKQLRTFSRVNWPGFPMKRSLIENGAAWGSRDMGDQTRWLA